MTDTPEAAEASSTSSGITSQHSDSDSSDDQFLSDPYADIRDHMEALAARDKATYAYHKHLEDIECIG